MFTRGMAQMTNHKYPAAVIGMVVAVALTLPFLCILGCEKEDLPVAAQSPVESINTANTMDVNIDDSAIQTKPPRDIAPDINIPCPPRPNRMVLVPAGTFIMGDGTAWCGQDEREVTLTNGFYLGQYEVTNREYCDALQWAYDSNPPLAAVTDTSVIDNFEENTCELLVDLNSYGSDCQISFSDGTFSVEPGKENHPVIEVSWYGAAAYCDWLSMRAGYTRSYDHSDWSCNEGDPYGASGYRLPTDAEREYAAQYDDERRYPWGNESPSCSYVNFHSSCQSGDWPRTAEVGSYPGAPSISGKFLFDMAGNVWEWCEDGYVCDLGGVGETDPYRAPVSPGSNRILRGGGWIGYGNDVACADRSFQLNPSVASNEFGFRIARTQ